jgi:hypothetical protein
MLLRSLLGRVLEALAIALGSLLDALNWSWARKRTSLAKSFSNCSYSSWARALRAFNTFWVFLMRFNSSFSTLWQAGLNRLSWVVAVNFRVVDSAHLKASMFTRHVILFWKNMPSYQSSLMEPQDHILCRPVSRLNSSKIPTPQKETSELPRFFSKIHPCAHRLSYRLVRPSIDSDSDSNIMLYHNYTLNCSILVYKKAVG